MVPVGAALVVFAAVAGFFVAAVAGFFLAPVAPFEAGRFIAFIATRPHTRQCGKAVLSVQ